MFSRIKSKFKNSPLLYYASSIAATWAGVGSLVVGIETAQQKGLVPFALWALGNTLACMVFGIFAPIIPKLREVFCSRLMKIVVGLMCPFHIWYSLNGIQSAIDDTILPSGAGAVTAYVLAIGFTLFLLRFGMVRNVLSDYMSWIAVYVVGTVLCTAAIIYSRGNMIALPTGADAAGFADGIKKCLLLIPGPFLYPYYFELLNYNDSNEDGTNKINIRLAFILGGITFGLYLTFTFLLAWTNFSPLLNIGKALLILLIAVSTLSSMQYGIYITFGQKAGFLLNSATILLWHFLMPLGVMGAWSLMANIRIYIVIGAILFALAWAFVDSRKAVQSK